MIKNTIIIILLLLLLITFYAYMCLSSNMMDFQKERMEHIAKKETEIKHKERKLLSIEESNNNLNKYKNMINKITIDISNASNELNVLTKYATQINTGITNDINRLNKSNSTNSQTTIIINDTPSITITPEKPENTEKTEKTEKENFGVEEHFETNIDDLDLPIEDGFITGLD